MTLTERLKLELVIREHLDRHGESFYTELANILAKINNETVDLRGRPNLRILQN